jgi:hypothetical protein
MPVTSQQMLRALCEKAHSHKLKSKCQSGNRINTNVTNANVYLGESSAPEVEEILDRVGTYGRQLWAILLCPDMLLEQLPSRA